MLMLPTRGQNAFEFVFVISVAIGVGVLFLAVADGQLQSATEQERIAALNDVAYVIQDEIILASYVQDGYERTFRVPEKADRFAYTIVSYENAIQLSSGPVSISYPIPNVTGTISKGERTIQKNGGITIS